MDDTQKSRTSDANTTRKRRSSILKSQRPPRTPFSELEFNVATPTDTVKSRRVSFSRRTGVAEFVTNEATTTWKNFYEEHNKSLESSGNDSEVKPSRQTIGHIGKRIFDQQFEEVEAVDFLRQINNPSLNINTSLTNINLNHQVSSLECTDNIKLLAPQTNFELSNFTENHSKLFGDELTAPTMGEMSERIAVNFSDIQPIDQGKDDLDEIQRDLERAKSNIMCLGSFTDRQNMSEYIEIDLNSTHMTVRNEESDMSITDTIHSPKVQDVSKSCSIDKKLSQGNDWVTDKENIALNPYVTPRESVNFAINGETDKVLVFDGKRLTLESDRDNKNFRQTLLPNGPEIKTPQRKTIVLNVNDDLPNFVEDMHISKNETYKGNLSSFTDDLPDIQLNKQPPNIIIHNEENLSVTEAAILQNIKEKAANKSKTQVYDNDNYNISITQALPAKIIQENARNRQTILYDDDGNVSVTEPVHSNVVLSKTSSSEKRSTIVFETDMGNISMTQALPAIIINKQVIEKERRLLFEDDEISVTQDLPVNVSNKPNNKKTSVSVSDSNKISLEGHSTTRKNSTGSNDTRSHRRNTIVYDNDAGNISVTQAIPSNIIIPENKTKPQRRDTIVYDKDGGDVSVTQAISSNIVIPENDTRPPRRNTIVYDNEAGNISVTQGIPHNIIMPEKETRPQRRNTIVYDDDAGNISVTQAIPSNIIMPEKETRPQRRNTIVYDNDAGNISVTQAIPSNIIMPEQETRPQRRNTIVYDNDAGNISVTQAIPSNIIMPEQETRPQRRNTIVYDNDAGNISVTQAIPSNIIMPENETRTQRRNTIVYDKDAGNISVTQAIPSNIIMPEQEIRPQRRNTIVYDNDAGNISVTQAIPSNIIMPEEETQPPWRKTIVYDNYEGNISVTQAIPSNIIMPEEETRPPRRNTILYENDAGNISVTQAIPSNIIMPEEETRPPRRNTIVYENDACNISVTQAIPTKIIMPEEETRPPRRNTIVYENDAGNISVTQAIPSNITMSEEVTRPPRRNTIVYDTDAGNISVTKTIPSNLIMLENDTRPPRRNTIVYNNESGNISVTQANTSNIIMPENLTEPPRRNTIVYDNDSGNISVTEMIPNEMVRETSSDLKNRKILSPEDAVENASDGQVMLKNIENASFTEGRKSITSQNKLNISETKAELDKMDLENNVKSTAPNLQKDMSTGENLLDEQKQAAVCENTTLNNSGTKKILADLSSSEKMLTHKVETHICENDKTNYHNYNDIHTSEISRLNMSTLSMTGNINADKHKTKGNKNENEDINISLTLENVKNKNVSFGEGCDVLMKEIPSSYSVIGKCTVKPTSSVIEGNHDLTHDEDSDARVVITKPIVVINTENTKNDTITSDSCKFDQSLQGDKRYNGDHIGNATITKPIPTILSSIQHEIGEKLIKESHMSCENISVRQEVLLYQVDTKCSKKSQDEPKDQQEKITSIAAQNMSVSASKNSKIDVLNDRENLKNEDIILNESRMNNFEKISDIKISSDELIVQDKSDLHLSDDSMSGGIEDKKIMAQISSNQQISKHFRGQENDKSSSESMFYITKDSDDDKKIYNQRKQNLSGTSPLEKKEDDSENVDHLHKKLVELKSVIREDNNGSPKNRYYEKIVSSDAEEEDEKKVSGLRMLNSMKERKSCRNANDTDYLLQMLSDLTEDKESDIMEDDEKHEPVMVKEHIALENKSGALEKRRISFIPKRQSIALNREDLLNNLSLAQAALQKSGFEVNESEEDTDKDSSIEEEESPQKKAVRMSNEVVKTLHFEEDDTASETSIKSDKISPLKKTAFGETSYMKESKAKVIPSYLKDVSDNIKALMHDLVKPTADTMPFDTVGLDKSLKRNPSTCSTQIQANLIASSQIDLNIELYSNPTSSYDIKTQAAYANEVSIISNKTNSITSPVKHCPIIDTDKLSEIELTNETKRFVRNRQPLQEQSVAANVLVFDHENPLNNIFFAPTECIDVHKYNPVKSDETLCGSDKTHSEQKLTNAKDIEVERVAMQYNVDSRGVLPRQQSGDASNEKIAGAQSITSTISKPMSIDQSIDVRTVEVKDIEINTSITMKGNKELLETSSSLTLVDDALTQNVFDVDIDSSTTTSRKSLAAKNPRSPVKIIYQIDECGAVPEHVFSDLTSNEEVTANNSDNKRKKRNYSSIKHKHATFSDADVTPKPTCKVQKMSTSPKNIIKTILDLHRGSPEKNKQNIEHITDEEMPSPDKVKKKSPRHSKDKTGTTITVQRLITEYHIETNMEHGLLNKQIVEALANKSRNANTVRLEDRKNNDVKGSFTSSKNANDKDEHSVCTSSQPVSECSMKSTNCVNWQPDLINEISSKNLVSECESSVNVVAKIDMLPFMGSHECEWEWSSGDTWWFRLLHARLRLCVRLAHRHGNAARTCVRADTPVLALTVEIAQHDKKNSVASTCVRFAAETMRYLCAAVGGGGGGVGMRAGEVPALVRRCAAAARVAARWGRAMQDARARLAYTLSEDGQLALKVANIGLRSVWEVRMRLELVVEEGGAAPWPRASDVRVCRVVSEWRVAEAQVRALLASVPRDWGHVPRTVWRIFKYLKNKTRDDDLLAA